MARQHGAWAFVHLGSDFASRAPEGSPIRAGLGDASVTPTGYDGQFAYYMAVAPLDAGCCMDSAAYRYARVGFPVLAGISGLGQPALVPYTMLLVNLVALGLTVMMLAGWLRRHGVSGWWALVYGFYPGVFQAIQTDTNEVLAYALVAAAVYLLEYGGRARVLWAGLFFGAAGLTRETTLLFPAIYSVSLLARGPGRARLSGLGLAALAAVPFVAYKLFLAATFGSLGLGFSSGGAEVATVPLGGLLSFAPFEPRQWVQLLGEVLPATLVAVLAVYRLVRGAPRWELFAYLANYVVLVLLLQRSSYFSFFDSGRIQAGVVLAAVIALPALLGITRRMPAAAGLAVVVAACLLWFAVVPAGLVAPHSFHVFKL
ncbi:MAG: glycosyltransferase 87 family protein [Candidatus Dormiibacterota bacterium]